VDHVLDLTTQAILLYGSWILTAAALLVALRFGRREGTSFYPLLVLAVLVGAFVEPLYDTAMMLYFYSTNGLVTHFTAFGIPQPLWTHSGYVVLYAVPAMLIVREASRGTLDARRVYMFAGLELVMSCVFEMIGINGGAYEYWGPHVLRIAHYPLIIGVLESAQVMTFAMAAVLIRRRLSDPVGGLSLFVLFPCTFLGVNFGAGWPTIIAIHLATGSAAITLVGTLLSLVLAGVVVRTVAGLASSTNESAGVSEPKVASA
jgi:hypothetical protein